jgi:hypothetical protein
VLGFAPGVPVCLVGYLPTPLTNQEGGERPQQQSLGRTAPREDNIPQPQLVSTQEGEAAARQIGAVEYIEWAQDIDELRTKREKLVWYGYYYHLSKSSYPRD